MTFLRDIGYDLPQRTMSSAEVAKLTGADVEFLEKKVGISSRHFLAHARWRARSG